jgi:hypothetical protein
MIQLFIETGIKPEGKYGRQIYFVMKLPEDRIEMNKIFGREFNNRNYSLINGIKRGNNSINRVGTQ